MKSAKIINIQEYKINKNYYTIGLLIGALKAEIENGTVELESVYNILTDSVKLAINSDLAIAGVAVK